MKKYYIGGLLTLITIAFATVTLAVNKHVVLCLLLLRYT